MFEIRDPEGHALWFGQSYHQDKPERVRPMLRKMIPHLPVDDIPGGVAYYRDVPGFRETWSEPDAAVGGAREPPLGPPRLPRAGPRRQPDRLRAALRVSDGASS